MKFVKAGIFFAVSFLLAWVTIFTFIQEPFMQTVPAKLLWYNTPSYPIYFYLLAALGAGLVAGTVISLYYYVTFSVAARARRRQTKDLEDQNALLRAELERLQKTCEILRAETTRHDTQRMPAVKRDMPPVTSARPPAIPGEGSPK